MIEAAERVITPMRRELVERIDDFRYQRRLPSRAEAIRRLIETGLRQGQAPDPDLIDQVRRFLAECESAISDMRRRANVLGS